MPAAKPRITDQALVDLYDMLMRGIEPELTQENLPLLGALYPPGSETETEAAAREARYEKAFTLCDERLATIVGRWKEDAQAHKRRVMGVQLTRSLAEDTHSITRIDDAIDAA